MWKLWLWGSASHHHMNFSELVFQPVNNSAVQWSLISAMEGAWYIQRIKKPVFQKSEFRTKYSLQNLLCAIQSQQENNADSRIWTFGILIDQWRLWTSIYILRIFCEIHSAMRHCDEIYTVKLQAVDRSTVQFWKLSAKSQKHQKHQISPS